MEEEGRGEGVTLVSVGELDSRKWSYYLNVVVRSADHSLERFDYCLLKYNYYLQFTKLHSLIHCSTLMTSAPASSLLHSLLSLSSLFSSYLDRESYTMYIRSACSSYKHS